MSARLRLTLAPLLAAAAILLLPSLAAAKPIGGVQIDAISAGETTAQIDSQLSAVTAAHGRIIRVEVNWSDLQPRQSGVNDPRFLASLDALIARANARGIQVLLFVDRTPCWASSAPSKSCSGPGDPNSFSVTKYPPSDVQDFVQVSTFLASRYMTKIAAYEIWNEPDQVNEKYWAGPNKVAGYVAMTKAVYQPLKAINPQLQVLAGSFVGIDGRWLQALYDKGIKGNYDGIAVHFYDLPLLGLKTTRQIEQKNGDNVPLWLTEYGWTSCRVKGGKGSGVDHPCVTAAGQAQAVGDLLRAVARTSWLKATIMYQLRDESASYRFGILDRAGKRKPVFKTLGAALAAKSLGSLRGPSLKLRRVGNRVLASGKGSIADTYTLTVKVGGQLRYKATLRTGPTATWSVKLPASLGTSLKVRITSQWSGRGVTKSR